MSTRKLLRMLWPERARGRVLAASGLALTIAAGGSMIAWASIPGSNNLFTAYIATETGNLRVIDADAGQTCLSTETKVAWGGGMRFRGIWKTVTPPYTSSDPVRKGDVLRYEGPVNQFGCTTPKGSWVSVAGQHSYPCLEYPQNWAPLALDGSPAPVYWVRVSANGTQIAKSANLRVDAYSYSGWLYLYLPELDVTKCAVAATPLTDQLDVTISRYPDLCANWVILRTLKGASYVSSGAEVTLTC